MERKRTRSSSGTAGFSASAITRQLKASQESSRLMNRSGPPMSAPASARPGGATEFRKSASTSRTTSASTFSSMSCLCLTRASLADLRGDSMTVAVCGTACGYSSRSTLLSSGKSRIQSSATPMQPRPPSTAAGTVPKSAAVMPLSNSPSWFEALMKR